MLVQSNLSKLTSASINSDHVLAEDWGKKALPQYDTILYTEAISN